MAAGTQGAAKEAAKRDGKATPPEEREPTQRVVLRRVHVIALPEGASIEELKGADEKTLRKLFGAEIAEAWTPVGEFEGATKEAAIEAHTGKPGTPDAKTGTFKAPTIKAWAGGLRLVAPPKPLVEKEAID